MSAIDTKGSKLESIIIMEVLENRGERIIIYFSKMCTNILCSPLALIQPLSNFNKIFILHVNFKSEAACM